MNSQRPLWLKTLRGAGFWIMIISAAALAFVGYVFSSVMGGIGLFFVPGALMLLTGVGILVIALKFAIKKRTRERSRSSMLTVVLILCLIAAVLSPFVFARRTIPLMSNGTTLGFAKLPFLSCGEFEVPVYVGNTRVFCLWGDSFDNPWFIYPFEDAQRFLCVYDDDTSVLVFVVDCNISITNRAESYGWPAWPPDDYTRKYMTDRTPKVVIGSKGVVRLPYYAELEEAADWVEKSTPSQLEKASFPTLDLGFYRLYIPKAVLLKELDPNRKSVWP